MGVVGTFDGLVLGENLRAKAVLALSSASLVTNSGGSLLRKSWGNSEGLISAGLLMWNLWDILRVHILRVTPEHGNTSMGHHRGTLRHCH